MKRLRIRGWRELIVLLTALACAASWAASQVRSMRDRSEVAYMTEKMKTVCVGRYLVDVPVQAQVSFSHERVAGFDVVTVEETETTFHQRLAAREAEITARAPATDGTGGMVEARDLRIPNMTGRTFMYGRNRGYLMHGERRIDDEYLSVEVHAHTGGFSYSLSAEYGDEARANLAEALLARLRPRREDEIPATPGFCIAHAVFSEPMPVQKAEHAVMHLGLPGHPDLAVALVSLPSGGTDPGLLARVAHNDGIASADEMLRVTKLRSDKRSINGRDGEELLERIREFNFTTTYTFSWESRGVTDDPMRPYLSLELQAGGGERPGSQPAGASLHEDALLALWDSIASSIRMRAGGPRPVPELPGEPPESKLGAMASAGQVCPQSGWWRCNEGGDGMTVHGGQVQFIRQGERMPQALLLPRQTVWQKLKRVQPSVETPDATAWALVDKRLRPRTEAPVALAPATIPAYGLDDGPTGGHGDERTVSLGAYVRTGEACPASGWWRCEESHALDGTRWFARGSLLPAATFQVPAGVFGKAAGPEVIQRRSVWQLVRHGQSSIGSESLVPAAKALAAVPPGEPQALV